MTRLDSVSCNSSGNASKRTRSGHHLVFETPQGNLSAFMQSLLTAYTVYFNQRHRRSGHVTDGRYGAKLVEGDEYLDALTRYIHLNPVRIKKLEKAPLRERLAALTAYPWSSYRG